MLLDRAKLDEGWTYHGRTVATHEDTDPGAIWRYPRVLDYMNVAGCEYEEDSEPVMERMLQMTHSKSALQNARKRQVH